MKNQITKLASNGLYKQAINLYSHLHHSSSLFLTKFTFPYLFKACAKLSSVRQGQILHTHLIKYGFNTDVYAATSVIDMYMKFTSVNSALKVFDEMPQPNIASLNACISGFSQNGCHVEAFRMFGVFSGSNFNALKMFDEMPQSNYASLNVFSHNGCYIEGFRMFGGFSGLNFRPDSVTIASVLSGCVNINHGVQMHCWGIKIGVEMDIYVATSILTMYLNCGYCVSATRLFGLVEYKNVVCYNAFISGLLQNGVEEVVLDVFKQMLLDEKPNEVTLISVLSGTANLKNVKFGRQVHGFIVKIELQYHTMVGTALVDMYSKCGFWLYAYGIFKELGGNRNLITWNSMISGMMLNEQTEKAVEIFVGLESEGLKPDSATWNSMIIGFSLLQKEAEAFMFFRKMVSSGVVPSLKSITSLLTACSSLSSLHRGQEIHGYIFRTGKIIDEFVVTAIMDMYMKCGQFPLARKVFDQLEVKYDDPAVWNVMISGYGRNGEGEAAFEIFSLMLKEKIQPNSATLNCMLSVCSQVGKLEKAWEVFSLMIRDFGLTPTLKQLNIMVDLLARSGRLDEARELLQLIPETSASVFASLLAASEHFSDAKMGEEMTKKLSELEPENPVPFVILSKLYARQGRWEDAERIRETIDERGLEKLPGYTTVGVT
ncbi:pentatricopeptide repeat-containing protein At2g02750 [Lycium barbarum]|uniref:pentatricopeptide repeat-containing protein At2g02750 n=1 Tax=Lycium barbarum TaxID=112863 RepID=UPI00293EC301|nr:pentatricopeptide repeat-containing protein At2g02750 [Lycium barbarum]